MQMVKKRPAKQEKAMPVMEAFGLEMMDISAKNYQTDCPFCDKEEHLQICKTTGKWHCFSCDAKGNQKSFLDQFYKMSLAQTNDWSELEEQRCISASVFKKLAFAKNPLKDQWLIPAYSPDGRLMNLYRAVKIKSNNKWRLFASPGTSHYPWLIKYNPKIKSTYIVEGHWDGPAWYEILSETKYLLASNIIALPGATALCLDHLDKLLFGRIRIIMDYDVPNAKTKKRAGSEGRKRLCSHIAGSVPAVTDLQYCNWEDSDFNDDTDIRDLLTELGPVETYESIHKLFTSPKVEDLEIKGQVNRNLIHDDYRKCESFDDILKDYQHAGLILTPRHEATIATVLATVISTNIPGRDQLWMRIIGPAACGKTTIVKIPEKAERFVYSLNQVTGFQSGYGKEDNSLIPYLAGRCTIVEDADPVISSVNCSQIFAELRVIYNQSTSAHYRTGKKVEHKDFRSTFIFCGTDHLKNFNQSYVGERFLDIDLAGDDFDHDGIMKMSSKSENEAHLCQDDGSDFEDRYRFLQQRAAGFLYYLETKIENPPVLSNRFLDFLTVCAKFVARLRSRKPRDSDEMALAIRAESANRVLNQLIRLTKSLCLVYGVESPTLKIREIVRCCAIDTAKGIPFKVCQILTRYPEGLNGTVLANRIGIASVAMTKALNVMCEFGIVAEGRMKARRGVYQGGRKTHVWTLTEDMTKIIARLDINNPF